MINATRDSPLVTRDEAELMNAVERTAKPNKQTFTQGRNFTSSCFH